VFSLTQITPLRPDTNIHDYYEDKARLTFSRRRFNAHSTSRAAHASLGSIVRDRDAGQAVSRIGMKLCEAQLSTNILNWLWEVVDSGARPTRLRRALGQLAPLSRGLSSATQQPQLEHQQEVGRTTPGHSSRPRELHRRPPSFPTNHAPPESSAPPTCHRGHA
jgi:hypothetical protein